VPLVCAVPCAVSSDALPLGCEKMKTGAPALAAPALAAPDSPRPNVLARGTREGKPTQSREKSHAAGRADGRGVVP
jgi:hypothetical protein